MARVGFFGGGELIVDDSLRIVALGLLDIDGLLIFALVLLEIAAGQFCFNILQLGGR